MRIDPGRVTLLVLALGLVTTRGITTLDEAIHLDRALSWARGESALSIDPGPLWVPTRAAAGGLFYDEGDGLRAAAPPGLSMIAFVLVAPVAWLEETPFRDRVDAMTRAGPVDATLAPLRRDLRAGVFSFIGPISAALVVCFFLLAARALELSTRAQVLGAAALALGSPLLAYAGTCWTQLPVTAALAYALWQVCERDRRPGLRATGLGLALGLAVLVRAECLLFAIPFGVATYQSEHRWRRSPSRSMLRLLLPVGAAVAALALLGGLPSAGGAWEASTLLVGVPGLLLSPRSGLVLFAPFVVLAPLGILALREERPLLWPLVALPALALVVYGGWFDWHASLTYGPRFLLPLLPALALAFSKAVDRVPTLAATLVGLGLLVELPGALLVHARVRELESFWDPTPLRAWSVVELDWAVLESTPIALALLGVGLAGVAWEWRHKAR